MGRIAAELAYARLGGDGGPPQRRTIPCELVARGSGEVPLHEARPAAAQRHPALLPRRPGDRRAARHRARGRPRARGLGRLDDDRVRRGRARAQPPARRAPAARRRRGRPGRACSARSTPPAAAPTRRCSSSCSTPASGCPSTSTRTTPSPAARSRTPYGKTEAWIVIATTKRRRRASRPASARTSRRETLARWVRDQDHDAMLGALNPIPVGAGRRDLRPAGHAARDRRRAC